MERPPFPLTFGEWLRQRRRALGVAQKALAAEVKCSVVTIRKIEAGQRRPSRQVAQLLAQFFEVPEGEHSVFIRYARGEAPDPQAVETVAGSRSSPWRAL